MSRRRVQQKLRRAGVMFVEVEEAIQRTGNRIGGLIAEPTQMPVVFDEPEHGRLIRDTVIDVVPPRPRRDHQEGLARTVPAAAVE